LKYKKNIMKVVFVKNHGSSLAWDIKDVKDWFARNLLIPNELAFPATEKIISATEDLRMKWNEIRSERKKQSLDAKSKLSSASLEFEWKADWDTLYASITEKDISAELKKKYSVEIDTKSIKNWHLKTVWDHQVDLTLTDWITITLKVAIFAEWVERKEKVKKEKKVIEPAKDEIDEMLESSTEKA